MKLDFKGDKLDINYIDEGNGEVIVILHGWGAYCEVYRLLINVLKSSYRVIAVDMPGFGKSTEPSFAYDVKDYSDFVSAFLKELGVLQCSIIGHSHGGRTAIELSSSQMPFCLTSLVLIDSAGIPPKKKLSKTLRIKFYKFCKALVLCAPVKKMFPTALDKLQKKFGSADYAAASAVMRQSMVKVVNADLTDKLSSIRVPTLLIWGENDTATPLSDAHIMEKKIPDCGLVTVKNAGHFCFADNPSLVVRVLKSFYKI